MAQRPLPENDTDAGTFWEGTAQRKLLIQRCSDCEHYQFYPRPVCLSCNSSNVAMVESGGRGIVYSFTVIHRGPYEDVPSPYVVAIVNLDEGVRLLSNIVGCDPADVRCDMPVQVKFEPLRDGITLPLFEPQR